MIFKSEIGYGHPVLVNVGIDHAIQNGFTHILKTRLDGIHLIPNIFDWCLNELGDKKYLTTQITSKDEMVLCDLFNFSEVNFMKSVGIREYGIYLRVDYSFMLKTFLMLAKKIRG